MAEGNQFQIPFESTAEEINPPDEDEYIQKLKDALVADEEVGPEVTAKIRDLDLRRITRAYLQEKDRWGQTFDHAKMWAVEAVKPGTLEFWKNPFDEELQKMATFMPMFYYGQDKQGHPICYEEVNNYNVPELKKYPVEMLKLFRDRITTSAYELNKRQTEIRGKPIYKRVVILNAKGLGVTSVKPFYDVISQVTGRESDLWAETVYKIFIINTGWLFSTLWYLLKGLAHPRTQKKFTILGSDYKAALLEVINEDQLPKEYQGTGTVPLVRGGWWFPSDNTLVGEEVAETIVLPDSGPEDFIEDEE